MEAVVLQDKEHVAAFRCLFAFCQRVFLQTMHVSAWGPAEQRWNQRARSDRETQHKEMKLLQQSQPPAFRSKNAARGFKHAEPILI